MNERSRRVVAGVIRLALVLAAMGIVAFWIYRRLPDQGHVRLQTEAPAPAQLGPGDIRIYNSDSSVDLILQGDRILTGLSEKTVGEVKAKLDSEQTKDTGLGGSIAQLVKKSVAGAIGTHAAFPLADIRDIHYDQGQLVFDWKRGVQNRVFDHVEVNHSKTKTFLPGDAQAFIDAFHSRKRQLGP